MQAGRQRFGRQRFGRELSHLDEVPLLQLGRVVLQGGAVAHAAAGRKRIGGVRPLAAARRQAGRCSILAAAAARRSLAALLLSQSHAARPLLCLQSFPARNACSCSCCTAGSSSLVDGDAGGHGDALLNVLALELLGHAPARTQVRPGQQPGPAAAGGRSTAPKQPLGTLTRSAGCRPSRPRPPAWRRACMPR